MKRTVERLSSFSYDCWILARRKNDVSHVCGHEPWTFQLTFFDVALCHSLWSEMWLITLVHSLRKHTLTYSFNSNIFRMNLQPFRICLWMFKCVTLMKFTRRTHERTYKLLETLHSSASTWDMNGHICGMKLRPLNKFSHTHTHIHFGF